MTRKSFISLPRSPKKYSGRRKEEVRTAERKIKKKQCTERLEALEKKAIPEKKGKLYLQALEL